MEPAELLDEKLEHFNIGTRGEVKHKITLAAKAWRRELGANECESVPDCAEKLSEASYQRPETEVPCTIQLFEDDESNKYMPFTDYYLKLSEGSVGKTFIARIWED